jgi:2-phospho-L-lactate guanylyltransferase
VASRAVRPEGLRDSHVVPPDDATAWGLVVPVKELSAAKSRLGAYGDPLRQELALAFAADVVTAALACPAVVRVLVVTDDQHAAGVLSALGAEVTRDRPRAGLNEALAHGAARLQSGRTHDGRGCRPSSLARRRAGGGPAPDVLGVVAVSADLPCLQGQDLTAALRDVPLGGRAFVPDVDRRGTTLLAAAPGVALDPAYGEGSRSRHLASGALELQGTPGLRRDVDTPEDLRAALALGVGPHTAAAATGL